MTGIGYTNGAAPDSALKFIDGTHVTPDVYDRVTLLQQLAAQHGLDVHVIRLGGYTNLAEQRARQTNSNKASTIPVALVGQSTHGVYSPGRVDLGSTTTSYTNAWLAQIIPLAEQCGLVREFGAADPNHFIASGAITWSPPAPHQPTQEELDDMAASLTADFIRDYETESSGKVRTALLYPTGELVLLNATQDVDAAVTAHVKAYGLPVTNANNAPVRTRYGAQMTKREFDAFVAVYPGRKVGF